MYYDYVSELHDVAMLLRFDREVNGLGYPVTAV